MMGEEMDKAHTHHCCKLMPGGNPCLQRPLCHPFHCAAGWTSMIGLDCWNPHSCESIFGSPVKHDYDCINYTSRGSEM